MVSVASVAVIFVLQVSNDNMQYVDESSKITNR